MTPNNTLLGAFQDELEKIAGLPRYLRSGKPKSKALQRRISAHNVGKDISLHHAVALPSQRKFLSKNDLLDEKGNPLSPFTTTRRKYPADMGRKIGAGRREKRKYEKLLREEK